MNFCVVIYRIDPILIIDLLFTIYRSNIVGKTNQFKHNSLFINLCCLQYSLSQWLGNRGVGVGTGGGREVNGRRGREGKGGEGRGREGKGGEGRGREGKGGEGRGREGKGGEGRGREGI